MHQYSNSFFFASGFVNTDMVADTGATDMDPERMIQPSDIAEAGMLVLRTSSNVCPQEITLRVTLPVKH